jgi:hypothetical protein
MSILAGKQPEAGATSLFVSGGRAELKLELELTVMLSHPDTVSATTVIIRSATVHCITPAFAWDAARSSTPTPTTTVSSTAERE